MKKLIFLFCLLLCAFLLVNFTTATLPMRCTFSPEIDCLDSLIIASEDGIGGSVSFRFRNNVGSTADFVINMTYFGEKNYFTSCVATGDNLSLNEVPSGQVREAKCIFNEGIFPVGDKAKFEVHTLAKKLNNSNWMLINGEIYATVHGENYNPVSAAKKQRVMDLIGIGVAIVLLLLICISFFVLVYYFFKKSNDTKDQTVVGIASLIISFSVYFFIFAFIGFNASPVGKFSLESSLFTLPLLFLFLLLSFFIWKAYPNIRNNRGLL